MKNHLSAEHFQTEEAAFAYVEAKLWANGPVCHHCGEANRIGRLQGKTNRAGLYKCYACRKPFTVRMGTIFESSHVPLRVWLHVMYLACSSKKGISTNQIQRTLQCSMKTAWFLGHRIRECMREVSDIVGPLGGKGMTIEADETYIGGKPGNRLSGKVAPKQSVLSLVERDGRVRSFRVPHVDATNLHPIIAKHAHPDSRFITDEAPVYRIPGQAMADHQSVNHSAKEYVRDDIFTNSAEGYFSVLKRGIYGVYQHVSEAHLHRYLHEFDFRHSNRAKLGVDDKMRADRALLGAVGKRLTYQGTRGTPTAKAANPA
jgi:transposase-like protein